MLHIFGTQFNGLIFIHTDMINVPSVIVHSVSYDRPRPRRFVGSPLTGMTSMNGCPCHSRCDTLKNPYCSNGKECRAYVISRLNRQW